MILSMNSTKAIFPLNRKYVNIALKTLERISFSHLNKCSSTLTLQCFFWSNVVTIMVEQFGISN